MGTSRLGRLTVAVSASLLVFLAEGNAQDPTAEGPAEDLRTLISVAADPKATSLQKDRLKGKRYRGTIRVTDIRDSSRDKPAAEIISEISQNRILILATTEVEKAAGLRKGDQIVVVGKFRAVSTPDSRYRSDSEFFEFTDVTIEKIVPKETPKSAK